MFAGGIEPTAVFAGVPTAVFAGVPTAVFAGVLTGVTSRRKCPTLLTFAAVGFERLTEAACR